MNKLFINTLIIGFFFFLCFATYIHNSQLSRRDSVQQAKKTMMVWESCPNVDSPLYLISYNLTSCSFHTEVFLRSSDAQFYDPWEVIPESGEFIIDHRNGNISVYNTSLKLFDYKIECEKGVTYYYPSVLDYNTARVRGLIFRAR